MSLTRVRKTFPPRPAMPMRGGVVDVAALLARSRAEFGDTRMERDDDDPPDPTEGLQRDEHGNIVISQAALKRLLTDEKRQGRSSGVKKLLEKLGVKDEPELETVVEAGRTAAATLEEVRKEKETDADRRIREAEERERKAEEREQKAAEREHQTRVKSALRDAGVSLTDKGQVPDAALRLVSVGTDADDADVVAEVETLKEQFPAFFTGEAAEPTPTAPGHGTGPSGTPPARPAPVKSGGLEKGRARAAERWPDTKKAATG